MQKYQEVEMEIIEFELEDVVRTSGELDNVGDGTIPTTPDVNVGL